MNCFVDFLTVRAWLFSIFPYLMGHRLKKNVACYVLRSTSAGMVLGKVLGRLVGIRVTHFDFRFVDVKDDKGDSIGRRLMYDDLATFLTDVDNDPLVQYIKKEACLQGRLPVFINKNIASRGLMDHTTAEYALYLIQVVVWWVKKEKQEDRLQALFLVERPWWQAIQRYATKHDVALFVTRPIFVAKGRALLALFFGERFILRLKSLRDKRRTSQITPQDVEQDDVKNVRLAVEFYGQLNFDHLGRHSDLFFWQHSQLRAQDMSVLFGHARDPLDQEKLHALTERGFEAVALSAAACKRDIPFFAPPVPNIKTDDWYVHLHRAGFKNRLETSWIVGQIDAYQRDKHFWKSLFAKHQIQMYVSWFKHAASHCAIADALTELGGISAYYQRSYEEHPSVAMAAAVDVEFGFSPKHAQLEKQSRSEIGYHVAVGFLGDHRAAHLKDEARVLREKLKGNGARRIVAFFDENTRGDARWHKGHAYTQFNYAFLLEKVLHTPWLGLVLKPKVPATLRYRLGAVNEILDQALATGRCHLYEGGIVTSSYPPALAALSADLAIHEHLYAATAAIESALAGTPTLLLDRDGWSVSNLYRLGVGQVVFKDWDTLWEACCEHLNHAEGIPHFGDWSSLIPELDPFCDGRAAERMGTYLMWLFEGLRSGKDRNLVMADAAERYGRLWGTDKIGVVKSN